MNSSTIRNPGGEVRFEVHLQKENFKFNAGHFVTFKGFREMLHGHNYRVGVRLIGSSIRHDGYLIDFGDVKKSCRKCCKVLNEHMLIPMLSDVMDIKINENTDSVELLCHVDDTKFVFPRKDCVLLPIVHSTAEELSIYFWDKIIEDVGLEFLLERGITEMEVSVSEDVNQTARFLHPLPKSTEEYSTLSVKSFVQSSTPKPCITNERKQTVTQLSQIVTDLKAMNHSSGCDCGKSFKIDLFEKLDAITKSLQTMEVRNVDENKEL